jgi:hypothetical protein
MDSKADPRGEWARSAPADLQAALNTFGLVTQRDKPYDQFNRELIAGDILARTAPREQYAELVTATGFLALPRY